MATPTTGLSPNNEQLHEQLVDALNALFGVHPGFRPTHAKGVICEGTFTPSAKAASLSRAKHFLDETTPLTVRFSNFTGIPNIPDTDPNASPRGMGIKFHVGGGPDSDIVAHSFNGFPVGTAEEFLEFLRALGNSGPDAAKPTPIEKFLSTRPRATAFAMTPKPAPASFASQSFFAVNAFRFIDAQGTSRHARYQIHPVDGDVHLRRRWYQIGELLVDESPNAFAKRPQNLKLWRNSPKRAITQRDIPLHGRMTGPAELGCC
jgi:catalase